MLESRNTLSDIFISYDRQDRPKAEMLARALEQEVWSVWWDPKIPPGKTYDQVIEQELEEARCVVVLWSRESVASDWRLPTIYRQFRRYQDWWIDEKSDLAAIRPLVDEIVKLFEQRAPWLLESEK